MQELFQIYLNNKFFLLQDIDIQIDDRQETI
jgi:hypothetical protein